MDLFLFSLFFFYLGLFYPFLSLSSFFHQREEQNECFGGGGRWRKQKKEKLQ